MKAVFITTKIPSLREFWNDDVTPPRLYIGLRSFSRNFFPIRSSSSNLVPSIDGGGCPVDKIEIASYISNIRLNLNKKEMILWIFDISEYLWLLWVLFLPLKDARFLSEMMTFTITIITIGVGLRLSNHLRPWPNWLTKMANLQAMNARWLNRLASDIRGWGLTCLRWPRITASPYQIIVKDRRQQYPSCCAPDGNGKDQSTGSDKDGR